ncbi:MAG: hypothetical protein KF812_06415 [Fimbriimonadaceae bacterium]|nr:hypothetical protein [Fimbriimonadaceae bacterium]
MKLNRSLSLVVLLGLSGAAFAQPQTFDTQTTKINVGVLLLEGMRSPAAPFPTFSGAPHVWGQLDRVPGVKPGGWVFENPLAKTTLSSSDATRWTALGGAPAVGTPITKRDAPYWEVALNSTDEGSLARYQVLCLSVANIPQLNPREREKLRKYVDQGGTLWVDLTTGTNNVDRINGTPYGFTINNDGSVLEANLGNSLLNYPNRMTRDDVALSGENSTLITQTIGSLGALDPVLSPVPSDSFRYLPVAGTAAGSTISIASIGQGHVVLTSRGTSAVLSRGYDSTAPGFPNTNYRFRSLPAYFDEKTYAAAKLAVNIASVGGEFSSGGAGNRRTNSTQVNLPAPLLRSFTEVNPGAFGPQNPPAFIDGRMVVTANGRVTVFDARNGFDLDGDGNPDDGVEDALDGQADVIWESQNMGSRLSAPTVATVPDTALAGPGGVINNQVWVTDATGRVHVFAADNSGTNIAPLVTIDPPTPTLADPDGPYPVAIQDGVALVTDTRSSNQAGRVWAIDVPSASLLTTAGAWSIDGTARLRQPSAAAALAYIPIQDSSGGVDRVAYIATKPVTIGSPTPAGMTSVWLGSRAEPPVSRRFIGPTVMELQTRASLQAVPVLLAPSGPLSHLGIRVHMLLPNGDPLTEAQMNQYLDGSVSQGANGYIRLGLTGANPLGLDLDGSDGNPNNDCGWRVDYTLDWGQIGGVGGVQPDSYVRGNLYFSDDSSLTRRVLGAPVVGPEGNIFVNTSAGVGNTGGTMFNLRESGRGDFVLVYRWDVYDFFQFTIDGTNTVSYPATVTDYDSIARFLPFLQRPITQFTLVGSPVVRGDTVYLQARGRKTIFGPGSDSPTTVMFALRANPGPMEFFISSSIPNNAAVVVRQPDISRSTNKTVPEITNTIPANSVTIQRQPDGTKKIVLDSAMTVRRGNMGDSISASMPVIVTVNGTSDTLYEPEALADNGSTFTGASSGRYSPLRYYAVFNGLDPVGSPAISGNTMYFGGASILPGLLATGFSFPLAENGLLFGLDIGLAGNDRFIRPAAPQAGEGGWLGSYPQRPWMNQLSLLNPNGGFQSATALKFPQIRGSQSFDDVRVRFLQAALPDVDLVSVAGGSGTLGVTSTDAVYGFRRADVVVADQGRVGRFDGAGNPLWVADSTRETGSEQPVGGSSAQVPFGEPSRAYPQPDGTILVADPSSNRVVRMDSAGRALRSISNFRVDPNHIPNGFQNSQTTTLRGPRDVLTFDSIVQPANNPFSNAQPYERWIHYLVADTGNNRAVEVVDRYAYDINSGRTLEAVQYTANGSVQRAIGVLFWHSPEELSGRRFAYNSIGRVYRGTGINRRVAVALGFGNVEPGRVTVGLDATGQQIDRNSGNGGVVIYDGNQTLVINEFTRPAITANAFLNFVGGAYTFTSPAQPQRQQKLTSLSSVTLRYVNLGSGPQLAVMVTEASGVYELVQPNMANPDVWAVRWMLPTEAYTGMRRPRDANEKPGAVAPLSANDLANNAIGFRPAYARRLDSGDVLIVSRFFGETFVRNPFNGEIFVVDGGFGGTGAQPGFDLNRYNLGFNSLSVKFELPPVQGIRGIANPQFAETE